MKQLHLLTSEAFAPYGEVIPAYQDQTSPFQIVLQEKEASGWQMAISRLSRGPISKLGLHSNSREVFEPLTGLGVMVVAKPDEPEQWEAFLLDQTVCLNKNVWHATFAVSKEATVRIMENSIVDSYEHVLAEPVVIYI